jgi:hypothetical protein
MTPDRPPTNDTSAWHLNASLRLDTAGRLYLKQGEGTEKQIVARRAFPWSIPNRYIALREREGGAEIALIDSLDELPQSLCQPIVDHLQRSGFIPVITSIDEIEVRHGYQNWKIRTDHGPVEMRVQEREDIRFLSNTRFTIKDADGNLYEIPDVSRLDPRSQTEFMKLV